MKEEMKRSSLAHTLKGDGKEEMLEEIVWILGYRDPKMDEGDGGFRIVDLGI